MSNSRFFPPRSETGAEAKETLGPGKLPPEGSDLVITAEGLALPGARLLAPRIVSADSARAILGLCKDHLAETWSRIMAFEIRNGIVEDLLMEQDVGPLLAALRVRVEDLEMTYPDGRSEPPTAEEALKVALVMIQTAQLGPKLDKVYAVGSGGSEFTSALKAKLAKLSPTFAAKVEEAAPTPATDDRWSTLKIAIPVVAIIAGLVIWKRSKMKE